MTADVLQEGLSLGIYEKALVNTSPSTADQWREFFSQVPQAGFSFLDLSIDESPQRAERLTWDSATCRRVREAAEAAGTQIGGVCLSLHRRIGPGSSDPEIRRRARQVMERGLQVCHEASVPVLQVAGYYAYYEPPVAEAERWYAELLAEAVPLAARLGVVMGIENVDGHDVTSIRKAMEFVKDINSPYLQVYPDLGNIAEQGMDPAVELEAGRGHMVALHAKDVRPGEPRRVEMGTGVVDWDQSFAILKDQGWTGRLMIEMWNDDAPDSIERCVAARSFLERRIVSSGLSIHPGAS